MTIGGPGRQLGRFTLPLTMVEHNAPLVQKVMGACVIIRCEYMYGKESFDYMAISSDFDPLAEGELIPEYVVWVNSDDSISFKRKPA